MLIKVQLLGRLTQNCSYSHPGFKNNFQKDEKRMIFGCFLVHWTLLLLLLLFPECDYLSHVFVFVFSRHQWLKTNLKYWQSTRCPAHRPPIPWMPLLLLLLAPNLWIFFIAFCVSQLTPYVSGVLSMATFVFFNLWAFRTHRIRHISALQSPAFAGFFFGLIIQSVCCYFGYLLPHILVTIKLKV